MFSASDANRSNYFKYLARLNFEAADAADKVIGCLSGYDVVAPPPVMTLCAHSIELSLKSYLLDRGACVADLKAIGHDLVKALDACVAVGARVNHMDREVLTYISDLLQSGRLRYGDKSKLGTAPVYGPLSRLCEQCLDLCGAPKMSEIVA